GSRRCRRGRGRAVVRRSRRRGSCVRGRWSASGWRFRPGGLATLRWRSAPVRLSGRSRRGRRRGCRPTCGSVRASRWGLRGGRGGRRGRSVRGAGGFRRASCGVFLAEFVGDGGHLGDVVGGGGGWGDGAGAGVGGGCLEAGPAAEEVL